MTFIVWPSQTVPPSETTPVPPKGVQTPVRAIDFPFRIDPSGRIATTNDIGQQALHRVLSVLGTSPFERCMRANYGVPLKEALFEPNDPIALTALATRMRDAVSAFEPGVVIENVNPITTDLDNATLMFEISFQVVRTGERRMATVSIGGSVTETGQ